VSHKVACLQHVFPVADASYLSCLLLRVNSLFNETNEIDSCVVSTARGVTTAPSANTVEVFVDDKPVEVDAGCTVLQVVSLYNFIIIIIVVIVWWSGVVVSALASINEVNQCRARLVLR